MFNVGYWQDYALLANSAHCNLNQYLSYIDGLPDTLEVDLRSGTAPGEYAATQWVELQPGFESGLSDNYVIYISDYDSAAGNIVACINPTPVADTVSIVTLDPPCEKAMDGTAAIVADNGEITASSTSAMFDARRDSKLLNSSNEK